MIKQYIINLSTGDGPPCLDEYVHTNTQCSHGLGVCLFVDDLKCSEQKIIPFFSQRVTLKAHWLFKHPIFKMQ